VAARTRPAVSFDVRKMFLTSKVVPSHAMKPYDTAQFISNVGTWVEVSGQLHAMAALPSV
jgi:hypothetical protein